MFLLFNSYATDHCITKKVIVCPVLPLLLGATFDFMAMYVFALGCGQKLALPVRLVCYL